MSTQNGRRGNCAKIHTADPVGMGRKWRQLTIFHSDWISFTVCIWRNFLVFQFAGPSIYNSFIYGRSWWTDYYRNSLHWSYNYKCSIRVRFPADATLGEFWVKHIFGNPYCILKILLKMSLIFSAPPWYAPLGKIFFLCSQQANSKSTLTSVYSYRQIG